MELYARHGHLPRRNPAVPASHAVGMAILGLPAGTAPLLVTPAVRKVILSPLAGQKTPGPGEGPSLLWLPLPPGVRCSKPRRRWSERLRY